jgi:hypothetical protein
LVHFLATSLRCHRKSVSGRRRNEPRASRGSSLVGGGQERSVRGPIGGSLHLSAQDGDLVAEHGVLKLRLSSGAFVRPEHSQDAQQQQIEKRGDHGAALSLYEEGSVVK